MCLGSGYVSESAQALAAAGREMPVWYSQAEDRHLAQCATSSNRPPGGGGGVEPLPVENLNARSSEIPRLSAVVEAAARFLAAAAEEVAASLRQAATRARQPLP